MEINVVQKYQETNYFCGPASLRMIMLHYGVSKVQVEIAAAAGTLVNGTTREGLVKAAKHFGFEKAEILQGWDNLKKKISEGIPVIAHLYVCPKHPLLWPGGKQLWEAGFGHYVVVTGLGFKENGEADYVSINDPIKGSIKCTAVSFNDAWDDDSSANKRDFHFVALK